MGERPAVIVISSHVVRGTVGNRAATLALEAMGFPVWSVPTITLPWHPGHGPATRIVPDENAFAAMLDDLANAQWLPEVGGILTGYLGSAAQVGPIARLIEAVRKANPSAHYTLDPVMGDGDRLYIPLEQAVAMRDKLLPLADAVTPNAFELAWLTGNAVATGDEDVIAQARSLGKPLVLATSCAGRSHGRITNMLIGETIVRAEHDRLDGPPNGLGDLTAALFTAHLLRQAPPVSAVERTTRSVAGIMALSASAGSDELLLEQGLQSLLEPDADIEIAEMAR